MNLDDRKRIIGEAYGLAADVITLCDVVKEIRELRASATDSDGLTDFQRPMFVRLGLDVRQ